MHLEKKYNMISNNIKHRTSHIVHRATCTDQFHKYQKVKAMQSFRQKFSEMIREYRDGFRLKSVNEKVKLESKKLEIRK